MKKELGDAVHLLTNKAMALIGWLELYCDRYQVPAKERKLIMEENRITIELLHQLRHLVKAMAKENGKDAKDREA